MIKYLFILFSLLSLSIVNAQVEKYYFDGSFSTSNLQVPMDNKISGTVSLSITKAYGHYTLNYNVSLANIDGTNVLNMKIRGPQLPNKDDGDLDIFLPFIKPTVTESAYVGSGYASVSDAASYNLLMTIIPNLQDSTYTKNLYLNVYQYTSVTNPVSSAKLIYKSAQIPEDPNGGPSTASSESSDTKSSSSEGSNTTSSPSPTTPPPTPTDPVVDSEVPKNSSSTNSTSAGSHDPLTDHSSEEKVPAHGSSSGNGANSIQVSFMFIIAALSFVTIFLF
ncbi:hypothetical protein CYY_000706 [Polysphondylium violaceum]|uniref:Uncharacterized protein n=1 Tax=Polysphondylium violaceum TaxID=133409 RepID=A0A8J4Q497_9MYCE|nr:hypothetical protein CYY_000706 [Polysphondylium violaceum]